MTTSRDERSGHGRARSAPGRIPRRRSPPPHPAGLSLGARARYTGERWARGDEANVTEPLDGYWLADARLGWTVGPWEAQAIVRNVLDTEYVAFGTFNINQAAGGVLDPFLTPGEPRRLEVVLRRAFGGAR